MRILLAGQIDQSAIAYLKCSHQVTHADYMGRDYLRALLADCDILVFRSGVSLDRELLGCAPHLQLVIRAGCGVDNIDIDYLQQRGIRLERIPEPAAQAVAEMSFALMLALARQLRTADVLLRGGRWAKYQLEGHLLAGKTLGIVGAGNIGSRVGQLAVAFGMFPIGCVEDCTPGTREELLKKGIVAASFETVLSRAQFVTVHVPLTHKTRHLLDAVALSRMRPGSFLVNLSRGGVVDEEALLTELLHGRRIKGAALDVHEVEGEGKISPLAALPNVILTPHIGAMTVDTQKEIGRRVVNIVDTFCNSHSERATELTSPNLGPQALPVTNV